MLRNSQRIVIGMALALVIVLAPQISANGGGVAVVDYSASGQTVQVTVTNSDSKPHSGFVVVNAVAGDVPSRSVVHFSVDGQRSATVTVAFPGVVSQIEQVGFSEDADPFN